MKFSRNTALIVGSLAVSATAIAASVVFDYRDSSSASYQVYKNADGLEVHDSTETRYMALGYPNEYLVKSTIQISRFASAEGETASVNIEVRGSSAGKRYNKVVWTAKEQGSDIEMPGSGFIGVRQYGCCAEPDVLRLLNIDNGKKVEAIQSSLFEVEVPNYPIPKRYLGLAIDSKAPQKLGRKSYIGTVSYFSNTNIISRARVYAEIPEEHGTGINDLKLVSTEPSNKQIVNRDGTRATLWHSDGFKSAQQGYKLFAITGSIQLEKSEAKLHLEIFEDDFDQATSRANSPGLELVFLK